MDPGQTNGPQSQEEEMKSDLASQVFDLIEREVSSRPTAMEFEMAYQARVAIDRIRFAIKHTEQSGFRSDQIREAGIQLLDALQRLEYIDRRFQDRSRHRQPTATSARDRGSAESAGGQARTVSHGPAGST